MVNVWCVFVVCGKVEKLPILDPRAVGVNKTLHLEFTTHMRPDYSPLLGGNWQRGYVLY